MPVLKVLVGEDTYERLVAEAVAQCRPVAWQAELALRRAVGLPSPVARKREPRRVAREAHQAQAAAQPPEATT